MRYSSIAQQSHFATAHTHGITQMKKGQSGGKTPQTPKPKTTPPARPKGNTPKKG